jgi:hypothetical protein
VKFKFLVLCLYIAISPTIPAQQTGLVTFDVLASKLDSTHHVKLYYKSTWFVDKLFKETMATMPLDECLTIIKRNVHLECIQMKPDCYVFVPEEVRNYSNNTNSNGVLLIGDGSNLEKGAKASISGKITDVYTGKPLKGATLGIETLNVLSTTDKDGNYKLLVPVGEYEIAINQTGFGEDIRRINVFGNGIVNFEIARRTIRLKEVVVNDQAADQNVVSSQMSAVKLNAKAIKELPLFLGEKDVLKSLKLLTGVQSTGEFGTGFFVRGGSQDQNLILIEDVPLFNSAHAFGLISALNSDGVNNVTLLKSGIPANYGERASSIMDIRMESNPEKTSVKGGIGLMDTRLNFETPLFNKKVSLLIGARTSYSNWLLHQMPEADLQNSSVNFYDLNALLNIKFNPKNKLVLFGYYSDDKYSLGNKNAYHYENLLGSVQYTHMFTDKLNATWMAGLSRYKNDMSELDSLAPKEAFKVNSAIHYYNTKLNFNWLPIDVHSFNFGLNAVKYTIQPGIRKPLVSLSEVDFKKTTEENGLEMAAYVSDKLHFSSPLSAEVGLRFSQYVNLGATTDWLSSLEPRLSLRYSLDEVSSLKLNFNRISQFINLISNTTVMSPTDVYKLSSRNTKPVRCDQVALGYFRNFNQNVFEASAEIYYKKLHNILEYKDGAELLLNDNLESDLLNASGYNYGLELSLKKNSGRLTGWANYTYSRSLRHTTGILKSEQINGNRYYASGSDQPHNVVLVGNYHLTRRWMASATFNYSTGRPVTLPELKYEYDGKQYIYYSDRNKYRLPDYHRLDVALTHDENLKLKRSWKGSWTFAILNLYARKNPYSVFYKSTANLDTKFRTTMNLYKMYIIEKPIPTITYNFTF